MPKSIYNPKTSKYIYPYNLIENMCIECTSNEAQTTLVSILKNGMSDDQLDGLNFILSTQLNNRQQEMLNYRYKDKLTYREIGEKYNITVDRVRQILMKIIRIIRMPENFNLIKYGSKGNAERIKKEFITEYGDENTNPYITRGEFGQRAYSTLIRGGIKTKKDLADMFKTDEGFKKLCRVRNLGRKSIILIRDILVEQGYLDPEEISKRLAL